GAAAPADGPGTARPAGAVGPPQRRAGRRTQGPGRKVAGAGLRPRPGPAEVRELAEDAGRGPAEPAAARPGAARPGGPAVGGGPVRQAEAGHGRAAGGTGEAAARPDGHPRPRAAGVREDAAAGPGAAAVAAAGRRTRGAAPGPPPG